jgi:hypothetical protein
MAEMAATYTSPASSTATEVCPALRSASPLIAGNTSHSSREGSIGSEGPPLVPPSESVSPSDVLDALDVLVGSALVGPALVPTVVSVVSVPLSAGSGSGSSPQPEPRQTKRQSLSRRSRAVCM